MTNFFQPWRWLAAAAVCVAAIAPASALGDLIALRGDMRTTVDLTDRIVVSVPPDIPRLTVRIPLPAEGRRAGSLAESETLDRVAVDPSRQPDASRIVYDASGNAYREFVFDRPLPGNLAIDTKMRGLTLESDLDTPLPQAPLPLRSIPTAVAVYLQPTSRVQCDAPEIVELARRITAGASTEADAAGRIALWLRRNISYGGEMGPGARNDAVSTLESRSALCEGWSQLFLALARASGLPARFVGGFTVSGTVSYPLDASGESDMQISSDSLGHAWVEIWYPGYGWAPYEPQDSAGFVDTHHVPIWTGLDASSNLPLLSWSSRNGYTHLSVGEEDEASHIDDDIDVSYAGHVGPDSRTVLFTR